MRNLWLILREIKWLTVAAFVLALAGVVVAFAGGSMTIVVSLIGAAIVLGVIDKS
jgi:hypothetical protein